MQERKSIWRHVAHLIFSLAVIAACIFAVIDIFETRKELFRMEVRLHEYARYIDELEAQINNHECEVCPWHVVR